MRKKRFPTAFQTVDIAVLKKEGNDYYVSMIRKPTKKLIQFCGGFSEPTSPSLEFDARKEVMEELGIEADMYMYIGSTLIDDERYRGTPDSIKTAIFVAKYIFGAIRPGDDIKDGDAMWVKINDLTENQIEENHRIIFRILKDKVFSNQKVLEYFFIDEISTLEINTPKTITLINR